MLLQSNQRREGYHVGVTTNPGREDYHVSISVLTDIIAHNRSKTTNIKYRKESLITKPKSPIKFP